MLVSSEFDQNKTIDLFSTGNLADYYKLYDTQLYISFISEALSTAVA